MAKPRGKSVVFRMNGVAAGFLREYGCRHCPRCHAPQPQTHLSASLLLYNHKPRGKELAHHILFECGLGVLDSLIDFGAPPVDGVFLSHGHAYHSLGLDRLMSGQFNHNGRSELPLYGTAATLATPQRIYPWYFTATNRPRLVPHEVTPCQAITLDCGVGLTLTPLPVFQGNSAPGAVIWIVEFGQGDRRRKIVLAWELVHFIPRHPSEDHGNNYAGPTTDAQNLAATFGPVFANTDELFFDGNTLQPCPETNHMSIEAGLRFLIPQVQPQRTWVTHYSGHEDACGPLTDAQLQDWLNATKPHYGLGTHDIRVAQQGMVLAFDA